MSGCAHSGTQEWNVFQLHLTHSANYWSGRHPHSHTLAHQEGGHISPSSHRLPGDKLGIELFMHAVFYSLSHSRNRGPPQSAGKRAALILCGFFTVEPQATASCSHCTCSISEHWQVIIRTLATKERAWECRWKRKEPKTRASGQVAEAPLRVDKQCEHLAISSPFLSLTDSEWAVNESESFSLRSVSRERDETSSSSYTWREALCCPLIISPMYRSFFNFFLLFSFFVRLLCGSKGPVMHINHMLLD